MFIVHFILKRVENQLIAHLHKQSIVELLVDELTVFFDLLLMFFLLHHVLIVDRFFFQLLHVVLVLLLLLLINFV